MASINISVDFNINVECDSVMNALELKKWLAARGCTFEKKRGGSGHIVVRRGSLKSEIPMHGARKELGTGLVNAITKQLELN